MQSPKTVHFAKVRFVSNKNQYGVQSGRKSLLCLILPNILFSTVQFSF